jgi:hypothetical protein
MQQLQRYLYLLLVPWWFIVLDLGLCYFFDGILPPRANGEKGLAPFFVSET